jgi:hypothetical protein
VSCCCCFFWFFTSQLVTNYNHVPQVFEGVGAGVASSKDLRGV